MFNNILAIETSCDETASAVFHISDNKVLSNELFSQVKLHEIYGGVVPEIASRSHLEKIDIIVQQALEKANKKLSDIDIVAVTNKPGLSGSLLVGLSFAKAIAWSLNKKLIGVNHLEAHVFSSFLNDDFSVRDDIQFPHLCLSVSGGHTALYLVHGFGDYEVVGQTVDDAAGEAFDKVAKIIGLGYPGGAVIEKLAGEVNFQDFFNYPRSRKLFKELKFSFSGLKTAVLYDLVKRGVYNLKTGPVEGMIDLNLQRQVSSSLLLAISDVFKQVVKQAFKKYPEVKGFTFVGGVACNKFITNELSNLCDRYGKQFVSPHCKFCGDNAAMISFVASYKAKQGKFSDFTLDLFD